MSEDQKNEILETKPIDIKEAVVETPTGEVKAEVSERPASTDGDTNRERSTNRDRGFNNNRDNRDNRRRERGGDHQDQRMPKFRKKVCRFCNDKNASIDYKRPDILEKFITDRGKILPRRVTGTCSKHQRAIAKAIKSARMIALLPFIEQ